MLHYSNCIQTGLTLLSNSTSSIDVCNRTEQWFLLQKCDTKLFLSLYLENIVIHLNNTYNLYVT